MAYTESLRRFLTIMALVGLLLLAYVAYMQPTVQFSAAVLFAALIVYSEWGQQILPSGVGSSASGALIVASALVFGPATAAMSILLGVSLIAFIRRSNPLVAAANAGIWLCAVMAGILLAERAGVFLPQDTNLAWLERPVLAYCGNVVVSSVLVTLGISMARSESFWSILPRYCLESAIPWAGALVAVTLITVLNAMWGLGAAIGVLLVIVCTQFLLARWGGRVRARAIDRILRRLQSSDHAHRPGTQLAVHYASAVAAELGLDPEQQNIVRETALLHDVALEGGPPHGQGADGSLPEEAGPPAHAVAAAKEIARVADLGAVAEAVLHHHASWSGDERSQGPSGDRIPVAARIVRAVDTYLENAALDPDLAHEVDPRAGLEALAKERGRSLWPPAADALRAVVTREVAQDTLVREGSRRLQMQASVEQVVRSFERARRNRLRLADRGGEWVHRWEAMHEFSRSVNSSLSTAEVAEILLEVATRLTGGGGLVAVADRDGAYVVRAVRRSTVDLLGQPFQLPDPAIAAALAGGRRATVNLRMPYEWSRPFARRGLSQGSLIPACWSGRLVAILLLACNRAHRDSEIELAEMAASQAAIALSNASLFEAKEAALRDLQELHSLTDAVFESMNTAVLVFDHELRLTRANRAAREMARSLGVECLAEGVSGRELAAAVRMERHGGPTPSPSSAGLDEVVVGEWEVVGPGGAARLTITRSSLENPGTGQSGTVVVCQDVTELARLQVKVAERERLAAVGQVAATASHEIRNPLAAVKGFLQVMQSSPTPESVARYLPVVLSEIERIETLTQDMLLLSRAPRKGEAACDLAEEVRSVVMLVSPHAEGYGVEIALSAPDGDVPVAIESARTRQVVLNLVQNAMDAMPEGGRLAIEIAPEGGWVVLQVTDSGPGIPEAVLKRLFEPFVTTKPSGTGLGLATSASIVQGAGGEIAAENRPEGGARFVVRLPKPAREGAEARGEASGAQV